MAKRIVLMALVALALSACGGGASGGGASGGGEHQQAKIRGCVPECLSGGADPGRIPPGSYTTQYFFDGHLTVTFRKAWMSHEDTPIVFWAKPEVKQDGVLRQLTFMEDIIPVEGKTFERKHRAKGVPITTAGWLHWLSNNPNLRVPDPKKRHNRRGGPPGEGSRYRHLRASEERRARLSPLS
jgi:hypothetical protein